MNGAHRVALLLPGQGSQAVGMGRDLAENYSTVRELYERADDLLGFSLSALCWHGPEELLRRTDHAQPAILLHSYAVWTVLPEAIRSSVVIAAGHSLGEFSAYLLADALSFPQALRLVRRRGELMASSGDRRPGTMSAVLGLDGARVAELCARVEVGTVVPANFNAPAQVVVSGEVEAVRRLEELAREAGARRVLPLSVSGAFHSPLMEWATEGLREALALDGPSDPRFPVVANAAARPVTTGAEARVLLLEQLTAPVRWVECVNAMRRAGVDHWLEVGPGRVLAGLLRRIDRSLAVSSVGDVLSVREMNGGGSGN